MLCDPADVEAELVGDDKQLLGVAVGRGQVSPALDMGEEPEPETRRAELAGHVLVPFGSMRMRRRRICPGS
jgi:hypothetical protein